MIYKYNKIVILNVKVIHILVYRELTINEKGVLMIY